MTRLNRLCQRYARILNGTSCEKRGTCHVTETRTRPIVRIHGRKTRIPLVSAYNFSFDAPGFDGKSNNVAYLPLQEGEVNRVLALARRMGITISSVHGHWLGTRPRLVTVHLQATERPIVFARKMRRILNQGNNQGNQ